MQYNENAAEMIGALIQERYRLDAELGRGGMGTVYRAYDTLLERPVAVKLLHEGALGAEGRLHLLHEARAAASLSHPNIIAVYDAGETDGAPYIVMELGPTETLRQRPMETPAAILRLARQVCLALEHAHGRGVIHRDLKPENILIAQAPVEIEPLGFLARLTDFGLARSAGSSHLTQEDSAMLGTLDYIAPEQATGAEIDGRTDLYSLGMILYELAAGQLPFSADNPVAALLQRLSQPPRPPSTYRPDLPPALETVILKLIALKPQERFASARAVIVALDALAMTASAGSSLPAAHLSKNAPPGRLPAALTSFIGRQQELSEVKELLNRSRMVTITGSGGRGKTRLALQTALDLQPGFPDGAWLVELAPLSDTRQVAQAVATALGLSEEPGQTWEEALAANLRTKCSLLVLDNCEHLVEACARLAESLLHSCPDVTILATSREALRLPGETVYHLAPLLTPDLENLPAFNELRQFEALRLFAERAAQVHPGFSLAPANAPVIAHICARLDGIPLAIELAAARASLLSLEQIDARLEDRFRLLTSGSRTALPHQQTLRLSIDWSYNLLSSDEQTLFRRLSVFSGGWTLEAAEAICGLQTEQASLVPARIIDLLSLLADRSLIEVQSGGLNNRFRMLETIRQYAAEKLALSGEGAAIRTRHLLWHAEMAHNADYSVNTSKEPGSWVNWLRAESNNLRQALEWSIQSGEFQTGLLLAGSLSFYYYTSTSTREGRQWIEQLLEAAPQETAARAQALNTAGGLAYLQNDYAEARRLGEASVALWQKLDDPAGMADAIHILGHSVFDLGDLPEAERLFRQSLALFQKLGEQVHCLTLTGDLGMVAYFQGDYPAARTAYEETLALARKLDEPVNIIQVSVRLGDLLRLEGDLPGAEDLYRESLTRARAIKSDREAACGLHKLAQVARKTGHLDKAFALLGESLSLQQAASNPQGIAECLLALGGVWRERGNTQCAARLFAAAQAILDSTGAPISPPDRDDAEADKAALRLAMDESAFQQAWQAGLALNAEEAAALALKP